MRLPAPAVASATAAIKWTNLFSPTPADWITSPQGLFAITDVAMGAGDRNTPLACISYTNSSGLYWCEPLSNTGCCICLCC